MVRITTKDAVPAGADGIKMSENVKNKFL